MGKWMIGMQFSETLSRRVEWNCESYEKFCGMQAVCFERNMFTYINSVVVFLSTVGFGCETGNIVLMEFLGIDVVGHDIQNINPQVSLLRVIGS